MDQDREELFVEREKLSGIPRDSVIHRINWDYATCTAELRRLLRCCENQIDVSLCVVEDEAYRKCGGSGTYLSW